MSSCHTDNLLYRLFYNVADQFCGKIGLFCSKVLRITKNCYFFVVSRQAYYSRFMGFNFFIIMNHGK